jgi:hypothetical protein
MVEQEKERETEREKKVLNERERERERGPEKEREREGGKEKEGGKKNVPIKWVEIRQQFIEKHANRRTNLRTKSMTFEMLPVVGSNATTHIM